MAGDPAVTMRCMIAPPPLRNQGPTVPPDDDRFPADEDYDDRFGPNPYDDELEDDNSNQFDR